MALRLLQPQRFKDMGAQANPLDGEYTQLRKTSRCRLADRFSAHYSGISRYFNNINSQIKIDNISD